jgi:muconolactone delta-isomerase
LRLTYIFRKIALYLIYFLRHNCRLGPVFDQIGDEDIHPLTFPRTLYMEPCNQQFMVDFTLPTDMTEQFVSCIPKQRSVVSKLFSEGKLLSYALSVEHQKLWAVFSVASESELMELLQTLPLTPYMKVHICELTFFNAATTFTPAFSFN